MQRRTDLRGEDRRTGPPVAVEPRCRPKGIRFGPAHRHSPRSPPPDRGISRRAHRPLRRRLGSSHQPPRRRGNPDTAERRQTALPNLRSTDRPRTVHIIGAFSRQPDRRHRDRRTGPTGAAITAHTVTAGRERPTVDNHRATDRVPGTTVRRRVYSVNRRAEGRSGEAPGAAPRCGAAAGPRGTSSALPTNLS